MKKTIIYLIIFVAVQVMVALGINMGVKLLFKDVDPSSANVLIITSGVTSAITIAIFYFTKWCPMTRDFIRSRQWMFLLWTVVFALGIIIPFARLEEFIPESWQINLVEEQMAGMLKSPEGYFVICMLAPLAEEIVFRGAIIRAMREWLAKRQQRTMQETVVETNPFCNGALLQSEDKTGAWIAIIVSAILFAGVHFNPAQVPHALLMGIILGWLYVKSGSIVPGVLVHWINNSTAYVFVNLYPHIPMDAHLSAYFGSDINVWKAVGYSMLIALPAFYQLLTIKVKK